MKIKGAILAIGIASLSLTGCLTYGVPGFVSGVFLVQAQIAPREAGSTILVSPRPGAYRALRFVVEGPPVLIYRVVVFYRDGYREDLPVNWVVNQGRWDHAMSLGGRDRAVERVMLYYRPLGQERRGDNGRGYQEARADVVRVYGVD
jgi:hypothetical protein